MKLTKKEICLIGMAFAMSAIAVLAIIGGSWLFTEIMFHLDRLTSDTILVTGLLISFMVWRCLYEVVFINQEKVMK